MDINSFLILGHIIGTAIGVGGATIADVLFFRSIRDGKISQDEFLTMKLLSRIIMAGFMLLVISGLGFFILLWLNTGSLAGMPDRMSAKLYIVAIIFLNSRILAYKVLPLIKNSVGKNIQPILERNSFLVLTSGSVSIISWYSALLLGSWREIPFSFIQILGIYICVLVVTCIVTNSIGVKRLKRILYD
jgi:hypothetical protein